MMTIFNSGIASDIEAMLVYRETRGLARRTYESEMKRFDEFCCNHHPDLNKLSREAVFAWLEKESEGKHNNMMRKAIAIRQLGKYLASVGKDAYILPKDFVSHKSSFMPYIFTDAELTAIFHAADSIAMNGKGDPFCCVVAPVLLRLIYTSGLRPNEGRNLKRTDINFDTGEIFISKTKRHKERIVVISDDMLNLCKKYDARRCLFAQGSEYFFPLQTGVPYTTRQLDYMFKKCWKIANQDSGISILPNVRVYDLRHRFASAVLNRWLDEKRDLFSMLPYLRAYMGHDNISATAYYIHLLPENIRKSSGIDWEALDRILPEVEA